MALYEINADATRGSGLFFKGRAGEAVVRGQLVYKGADGQWFLADADAAATMPVIGLTLDVASVAGQIIRILTPGGFMGRSDWAWTTGGELYASNVAGVITQTAPVGPGDIVQVVGMATKTNQIQFNPQGGGGSAATSNLLAGSTAYVGFDTAKAPLLNYFVADGVADNVTINAAEAYVTALGGGTVELEEGTYVLAAGGSITPTGNEVWYKGQGPETFINGDALLTTQHAFNVVARSDIRISDMSIQTQDGGTKTCHCIFFDNGSDRFHVENVTIVDSDSDGIHIEGTNIVDGKIIGCNILDVDDNGIHVDMDGGNFLQRVIIEQNSIVGAGVNGMFLNELLYSEIIGNTCVQSTAAGIRLTNTDMSVVSGNACQNNATLGILVTSSEYNSISNNECIGNTQEGISLTTTSDNNDIEGNVSRQNTLAGLILNASNNNVVSGNIFNENVDNGIDLLNANNNVITGNECNENDSGNTGTYSGINIRGDSDDNIIHSNECNDNDLYGINVTAGTCNDNWIKNNQMQGNTTAAIIDSGTDTHLAVMAYQFTEAVNGAAVVTSPTGIDVDANTEAALAWGQIPHEVQQVVRLKIWGVATDAPIGAGGQMHCEFTFNAGASNAAYNTAGKSWNIANFDGEEADYVANDVIHWVIEDADVGTELRGLVEGDSFEILAIHEAGADPDGATDCLFRVVEVEYV